MRRPWISCDDVSERVVCADRNEIRSVNTPTRTLALLALVAGFAVLAATAWVRAEDDACLEYASLRPQDEFWIASTRDLCEIPSTGSELPIDWQRQGPDGARQPSTIDALVENASQAITVFYVPGNRIANEEAERRAWRLYGVLKAASDEQPLRVVLWSWPSDKIKGQRADIRVKSERTFPESFYLGAVLRRLKVHDKVSLVGYSFGARIICGALHLVSGGMLDGLALDGTPLGGDTPDGDLPPTAATAAQFRVLLMAAAAPTSWLLPDGYHAGALSQVHQMLILYNPQDAALRHFHLMDPDRQRALGYAGLDLRRLPGYRAASQESPAESLAAGHDRVRQRAVQLEIGNAHDENRYYLSRRVLEELQRYALWGPPNP